MTVATVSADRFTASSILLRSLWYTSRSALYSVLVLLMFEPLWRRIVQAWPYSDRALVTLSTVVVHEVLYYGVNGLFMLCEAKGWLAQYKLPRKPVQHPSAKLVAKTLRDAVMGQLLQPVTMWFVAYPVFQACGSPLASAPFPSPAKAFVFFVVAAYFNEITFYLSHRAFHSQALYRFHKQHHEYTGTIGFAAEYAGPLEQALANHIPTIGGCMFFGAHPAVWLVWLSARLTNTYEAHSGYAFRDTLLAKVGILHPDAAAHHDWHHTHNTGNYGWELEDYFLGTMDTYIDYCKGGSKAVGKGVKEGKGKEEAEGAEANGQQKEEENGAVANGNKSKDD